MMTKGQKRSNREVRKPKKQKEPVPVPAAPVKGVVASVGVPQKKKA